MYQTSSKYEKELFDQIKKLKTNFLVCQMHNNTNLIVLNTF